MRVLSETEIDRVAGGPWASVWIENDRYYDYDGNGQWDAILSGGQWVGGNDNDGNGMPDLLDAMEQYRMPRPGGGPDPQ